MHLAPPKRHQTRNHHRSILYRALQEQWGKLAPAWDNFNDNQLGRLLSLVNTNWNKLATHISTADLAALSTEIQEKLGIGPEVLDFLKNINVKDVAGWAKEQWDRIPLDNLMSMDWSVLQKVPIAEVKTWTEVRICNHMHCWAFIAIFFADRSTHNDIKIRCTRHLHRMFAIKMSSLNMYRVL